MLQQQRFWAQSDTAAGLVQLHRSTQGRRFRTHLTGRPAHLLCR